MPIYKVNLRESSVQVYDLTQQKALLQWVKFRYAVLFVMKHEEHVKDIITVCFPSLFSNEYRVNLP